MESKYETSLAVIQTLIFGDDRLLELPILSKSSGDTAKVVKIHLQLGKELKGFDKEEKYFHIELFPTHAEVWFPFEWNESNARRIRQRKFHDDYRKSYNKNSARHKEIAERLRNLGFNQPGYAEHLANQVLKSYNTADYSQALKLLDLADLITKFNDEDNGSHD